MLSRTTRFRWFHLLADAMLVLSLLGLVTVYILWSMCQRPGGVEWDIGSESSQSRLMICSRDNRLIVGLYTPWRNYWGRMNRGSVNDLLDDPDLYLSFDAFGWGVAAPHWAAALLLMMVPAWWLVMWHRRTQEKLRSGEGLCRSCGYDIRASDDRCPECGKPLPRLALRRPTTTQTHS